MGAADVAANGGAGSSVDDVDGAADADETAAAAAASADGLGALPSKWEKAYTENGESYFIE